MLSHHASSAAPQTVQTAPPVCGAKNLSSVRLYSAPQLHRTIVAMLGICARNGQFSSPDCATIKLIQRRSGRRTYDRWRPGSICLRNLLLWLPAGPKPIRRLVDIGAEVFDQIANYI
jgi:hypothetical protein